MVYKRLVSILPSWIRLRSCSSIKPDSIGAMVKEDNGDVWLSPKEAADKLGLSVSRLYHIKNRLTHRKGNSVTSRVYFLESTLFDDYMNEC